MRQALRISAMAALALAVGAGAAGAALAQTPTPVAKLDLSQFIASWYEIARYPIRQQKDCLGDELVLYAYGDKQNTFQMVTSCLIKDDNSDWWNKNGKLDPGGSGALRLTWFWFLSTRYSVLAAGPGYDWALVGTPNHKSLWILAKTPTLAPEVLAGIEAQAAAQGFNTSRLIKIPRQNKAQPSK